MSGTYILWVNRGFGWEKATAGSWDHVNAQRLDRGGRITFCPPGHNPTTADLLAATP